MFFESLHSFEITRMAALQSMHSAPLDTIMRFLNSFDTIQFYLLLVTVIWYSYDQKIGVRLFFLAIASIAINGYVKAVCGQPRPEAFSPSVALLHASSFGFPSGGAQNMTALFLFLAFTIRKQWFSILSLLFVLLISFSRVYLGVHFPSDVVGGWIIGAALCAVYMWALPTIESYVTAFSPWTNFWLSVATPLAIYEVLLRNDPLKSSFSLVVPACSIGLIWSAPLPPPQLFRQRIGRTIIGLLGLLMIFWGADQYPESFRYILFGLWLSLLTPAICRLRRI